MKPISHVVLSPTLGLSECRDGFWLYDETSGMNLSMRAKSAQAAYVEALTYYQKRLKEVEKAYADLKSSVGLFVEQHCEHDEHDGDY